MLADLSLPEVWPCTAADEARARQIAARLGAPLLAVGSDPAAAEPGRLWLRVSEESGLALCETGRKAPGPVQADFLSGAVAHRRQFGGGSGQQIARAVGIAPGVRPRIADLTAGLGRDAFVLATLGCEVTLVERHPVIALLLEDGLARAAPDPEVGPIVARMHLSRCDAGDWLEQRLEAPESAWPEVIYLDPMFPHRGKSAAVKKEMRQFRALVGGDEDAGRLLPLALKVALARVVVKRPRKSPWLNDQKPGYSLEGKSGRFDIYPLRALRRQ